MLSSLIRAGDLRPLQLAFELDTAPTTAEGLLTRLQGLGLRRTTRCRLTRNRSVMVSYKGADLRVHESFLGAPGPVHEAIVRFVESRTRAERRKAQRVILAHAAATGADAGPALRRERTRPADEPLVVRLTEWHTLYNAERFENTLRPIQVRVSRRMRSRLGHYTPAAHSHPPEIAISWRHLRRHGWDEALKTLLHEMVHQWQDETGRALDHGPAFKAKLKAVSR